MGRFNWIKKSYTLPEYGGELESGDWKLVDFHKEEDAPLERTRAIWSGYPEDYAPPGHYKVLRRGDTVVMSNTPMELVSNYRALKDATGDVLINGLGMALLAHSIALKEDVTSVTVIELDEKLIDMLQHCLHDKITTINADAFTWTPPKGRRWNFV